MSDVSSPPLLQEKDRIKLDYDRLRSEQVQLSAAIRDTQTKLNLLKAKYEANQDMIGVYKEVVEAMESNAGQ